MLLSDSEVIGRQSYRVTIAVFEVVHLPLDEYDIADVSHVLRDLTCAFCPVLKNQPAIHI